MAGGYTGHLVPRETRKGKHYQLVIEGPRDPVTGRRERSYETLRLPKREVEKVLHERLARLNQAAEGAESGKRLGGVAGRMDGTVPEGGSPLLPPLITAGGFGRYIQPELGMEPLKSLDGVTLQRYVNRLAASSPLSGQALSAKSIRNIFNLLHAALETAVTLRMIRYNPCEGVHLPRLIKPKEAVLSPEMVQKLLGAAHGTDVYLILILGFALGLRRGEMAALRWPDIDLDKGIVPYPSESVNAGGKVIEKPPKTSAGVRDIDLGDRLVQILAAYREKANGPFVLIRSDGQPYSPDTLTRKFKRFLERNGLRIYGCTICGI